jgi:hypothetical protein
MRKFWNVKLMQDNFAAAHDTDKTMKFYHIVWVSKNVHNMKAAHSCDTYYNLVMCSSLQLNCTHFQILLLSVVTTMIFHNVKIYGSHL